MKNKASKWILGALIASCILAVFVFSLVPKEGWRQKNGDTQYILKGKPVTGWHVIDSSTYNFRENGALCTYWQEIDGNTYYLGSDGAMVTGWLTLADAQYYLGTDGILVTGWQELDGKQYHFEENGAASIGIIIENGAAYLFNESGHLTSGWVTLEEKVYYGDENCHPVYGWNEINGKQHYFDETGAAASGWVKLDGFLYYFYTDGAPAQGSLLIEDQMHHFAPNGQVLYLVNPWNRLPEDYSVELTPITDTHKIATVAYDDYVTMIADCEAAGFTPVVCSSYRTQEYQEGLFQNRIIRYMDEGYSEEEATELAGHSVAIPGTSEHQLGLALDIVDSKNWRLDESQDRMPTPKWLMENSWRYGWILRYPVDKSEITGIIYEPWHYRYVGRDIAEQIHELGVCLEEYLELLTNSVG